MTSDEKRVIALAVAMLLYVLSLGGEPWYWWLALIWDGVKLTFAWLAELVASILGVLL